MAAPLATSASDCCAPCDSIPITQVPGPAGVAGAAGTNGTNGVSAFTTTTAGFTMPAVAATVVVAVATTAWMSVGQVVFVRNAGYFTVNAIGSAISVTLTNLGYVGNAAPAAVIGSGQTVSAGGLKGVDGVAVGVTLNSISPTTTRGDLIVDNGALSPAASDVRFPAGTDGQLLAALAAQPTGLIYKTLTPNAATDNVLPRFDASGLTTPTPLQSSSINLTDNGALQHTGGNAKGTDAVDLQPSRAVATQVASGNNSVISGGLNNTGSGAQSVVSGGNGNISSNTQAAIVGGTLNAASGLGSFIGSGLSNIASGSYTGVASGRANTASGLEASVGGGNTNVASGDQSHIGGGELNTATADDSTVAGGRNNDATGSKSVVGGGVDNVASALYSTIAGGGGNTVSAQYASCIGGLNNTVTGDRASCLGGNNALLDKYGQVGHSAGRFAADGDCQTSQLIWRRSTTDATANQLMYLDGSGATQLAIVPNNTTLAFHIIGMARRDTGVSISFEVKGAIQNNAGVVSLVAAVTAAVIADGTGAALTIANFVVDADDPSNSLRIRVTGIAAQNWRWSAHARILEGAY